MDPVNRDRRYLLMLAVVCLGGVSAGCRATPAATIEDMGDLAKRRDLVRFRTLFTDESKDLLRRRWREDGLTEPQGWLDLMIGYLGKDREPPQILGEQMVGEDEKEAIVKVAKDLDKQGKRIIQDLRLIKLDDEWKVVLGAMVYTEQDLETGKENKLKSPPKPVDEDWGLEEVQDQKKSREDLEDFDLDKL